MTLYELTKRRLTRYGVFTPAVIELVARYAAEQAQFTSYQDFFASVGAGEPILFTGTNNAVVPVLDIPSRKLPAKGVLVVHASMETPLDENLRYQLATIAAVNSEYRVIGFGNPSGDRFFVKGQELTFWARCKIAVFKDLRPIVTPEQEYLHSQDISECHQIGFSYGALKAVASSQLLKRGALKGILLLDPVSHPRNVFKLVRDFSKTYGPLGEYVNRVNLETYHIARGDAARNRNHKKSLTRPINRAIGIALSRIAIFKRLKRVMEKQPEASVMIVWGEASELADSEKIQDAVHASGAIKAIPLRGAEHAFANDIHLYATIVREFLART